MDNENTNLQNSDECQVEENYKNGKDTRSRKWQLTLNEPVEKGFTHDKLKELTQTLKGVVYWCMSDEIGMETKRYHTHFYIAFKDACRFSTLQKLFKGAHFEMAKGTSQQNRDYVFKEGKWLHDKKADTNLRDTHEEFGEMPLERQGYRSDIEDLYDMVKQGMSNFDILENAPQYLLNIDKVEKVRQIVKEESYKTVFRHLDVNYIYGHTGVGKTRGIMEMYGYENIFRVTDFDHPFDNYKGQDIIIFEEFRSSLKIQEMLNYLDGYPLELPCRYANKIACYTKVYIITNIPLSAQYEGTQREYKETWDAFLRRINRVICMSEKQSDMFTVQQYFSKDTDFVSVKYIQEQIPFLD